MAEEKPERPYPVRSLHDFLSELDREWDKFRMGSLIGMVTSGALLVFFVLRFLLWAIRRLDVVDIVFFLFITILLVYSIYTLLTQYQFFKKWERRIGLLLHLEEKLIGEKIEEETPK